MANLTIRNLDQGVKTRLRIRAAKHGRSMEDEVREILRTVLAEESGSETNLAQTVRRRFAPIGGVELALPPRESGRDPMDFRK